MPPSNSVGPDLAPVGAAQRLVLPVDVVRPDHALEEGVGGRGQRPCHRVCLFGQLLLQLVDGVPDPGRELGVQLLGSCGRRRRPGGAGSPAAAGIDDVGVVAVEVGPAAGPRVRPEPGVVTRPAGSPTRRSSARGSATGTGEPRAPAAPSITAFTTAALQLLLRALPTGDRVGIDRADDRPGHPQHDAAVLDLELQEPVERLVDDRCPRVRPAVVTQLLQRLLAGRGGGHEIGTSGAARRCPPPGSRARGWPPRGSRPRRRSTG